ncbi:MAG: CHASE domain-containing protein, partial [Lentisphaeria bacterium]|nr:CHASE domain-containing protein [Lentisphaeria bacterium]
SEAASSGCGGSCGPAPIESYPVLRQALREWRSAVGGPVRDEGGTWFAAMAPVRDPMDGKPLAVLLLEVAVLDWRRRLLPAVWPGLVVTLFVLGLTWGSHVRTRRRVRLEAAARRQNSVLEPPLLMAVGVVLTVFCAWRVAVHDVARHRQKFQSFAEDATGLIARNFNDIRHFELDGVAGFLQHSRDISRSEFSTYISHMTQHAMVQVWAWVSVVPEAEREPFEASVRAAGLPSYQIWQVAEDGRRVPAERRPCYYPVVFAAPEAGNAEVPGFDLGSEPRRRAAIEEALASKLPTATAPLQLVHQTAGRKSLLVLQPVLDGPDRQVRGFAVAAIQVSMLFGPEPERFNGTQMSISVLQPPGQPEVLASTNGLVTSPGALVMSRPVFASGKALAVTATSPPKAVDVRMLSRVLLVLAAGLLLSGAVTVLAMAMTRRGLELSFLVAERTSSLSRTEERFHQLAANTRTVYWECDPQGLYTLVGPGAVNVYGYAPEELIGKRYFYDLHPAEGREDFKKMALDFFQTRQPSFEFSNPIETKDGRVLIMSTSGMPILSGDGELAGYYGTDRDVTEREQLLEELRRSHQEAVAANQAKSDFLTNMSHEIRTPINGIVGLADLLRDSDLKQEQREFVDIIDTSGRLLLDLVNEILDFSRIEAGRIAPVQEYFDLRRLVEDVVSGLALSAQAKQVELYCQVAPEAPVQMYGDDFHLRQILVNLTGNAIKFTDRGEIVLSVVVQGEQTGRKVFRFAVRDTGIGISPEQQPRVFQTFFQADSSISRRHGGSGLDLAIVKRLVEKLGGEIGFVSDFGVGTEFFFTLPLVARPGVAALPEAWPAELRQGAVVVIERHDGLRQELAARLAAVGMRVRTAATLEQAAAALAGAGAGTFVLLDLGLPELVTGAGGDGPPAVLLRPELRLIGLCHLCRSEDDECRSALPLAAELHKPVRTDELIEALRLAAAAADRRQVEKAMAETAAAAPGGRSKADCGDADAGRPVAADGLSVLLAEDNVVNQKVTLALMQKIGLHADLAANGREVLAMLKEKDYRLVLMDVQMPEMDGLEAARLIRDPATPVRNHAITIIALTAHAVGGYKETCLNAGMDDYIAKPITASGLREVLKRWLKTSS